MENFLSFKIVSRRDFSCFHCPLKPILSFTQLCIGVHNNLNEMYRLGLDITIFNISIHHLDILSIQPFDIRVTRVANTPTVHHLIAISLANIELKLKDNLKKSVARELRKEGVAFANCLTPFKVVHALAALKVINSLSPD